MTPTPTDPAEIDLGQLGQRYLNASTAGQAGMVNHLITAVEALRERVAELAGALKMLASYAKWQIDEGADHHPTLPSAVAQAHAALSATPAKALERARAVQELEIVCRNILSKLNTDIRSKTALENALTRLDQYTVAPAKAGAGGEEDG